MTRYYYRSVYRSAALMTITESANLLPQLQLFVDTVAGDQSPEAIEAHEQAVALLPLVRAIAEASPVAAAAVAEGAEEPTFAPVAMGALPPPPSGDGTVGVKQGEEAPSYRGSRRRRSRGSSGKKKKKRSSGGKKKKRSKGSSGRRRRR